MNTIASQWFTAAELSDLLYQAELNASSEWEIDFVADTVERHRKFGVDMYLSEKQVSTLERIAEGE